MQIKHTKHNNKLIIYLYGELDQQYSSNAKDIIDKIIDTNMTANYVVFDLSALEFIDSTGIGTIIGRYKRLKNLNIPSYITGANANTEKIIHLSGLYKIMPKY